MSVIQNSWVSTLQGVLCLCRYVPDMSVISQVSVKLVSTVGLCMGKGLLCIHIQAFIQSMEFSTPDVDLPSLEFLKCT